MARTHGTTVRSGNATSARLDEGAGVGTAFAATGSLFDVRDVLFFEVALVFAVLALLTCERPR